MEIRAPHALLTPSPAAAESLSARYTRVRAVTCALAAPLSAEDAQAQSMPDASPAKWHLAHTSWFFERFVLGTDPAFRPSHPEWHVLFNSYYRSVGRFHSRAARGLLTRPSLAEVLAWRDAVDARVLARLAGDGADDDLVMRVTLGINHEQQHQELLLTDIKHLFASNPLKPIYHATPCAASSAPAPLAFVAGPVGAQWIGAAGDAFSYDNEGPRHAEWLAPFALANRLLTNAEYREFIDAGGYRTPSLWLSDGWDHVEREGWTHPLYWSRDLSAEFTLSGERALDPHAPVCHLSYYEADACARWAGARLPREAEWEVMAASAAVRGNLQERGVFQPLAATSGTPQFFGDVWEWTASAYLAYPGFTPLAGAFGEYNGKFMSGQMVLKGGSCVTPAEHIRASYRNFFAPASRWQFMGLRLARDA
ncbi:MAG TPA: ergothioneine biosynthesis protein EgtB [Rhodanobacteraceae bacterium]|nr:ergothioneine biosynthesis protein EgtB [Rhodanobacteraceae bacterium]